jgi:hypothetical protein
MQLHNNASACNYMPLHACNDYVIACRGYCEHVNVLSDTRTRTNIHRHTHTHAHAHTLTHTRARARAHARTHAHTHTHTHTHVIGHGHAHGYRDSHAPWRNRFGGAAGARRCSASRPRPARRQSKTVRRVGIAEIPVRHCQTHRSLGSGCSDVLHRFDPCLTGMCRDIQGPQGTPRAGARHGPSHVPRPEPSPPLSLGFLGPCSLNASRPQRARPTAPGADSPHAFAGCRARRKGSVA